MTSIVGHDEVVVSQRHAATIGNYHTTTAKNFRANQFAQDVQTLNTITAKEKSLLDSLSERVRPNRSS